MWSHHGFWNNLEQPGAGGYPGAGGPSGGPPYYPGYEQDLSSYYKNYGYEVLGSFGSRLEADSPNRGEYICNSRHRKLIFLFRVQLWSVDVDPCEREMQGGADPAHPARQ